MASPKFRRMNYGLYEALMKAEVSGSVFRVILCVYDQSQGYQRQTAAISLARFERSTGLSRPGVCKAIKHAEKLHILQVFRRETSVHEATTYGINLESEWLASKQLLTTPLVNSCLPEQLTVVYQNSKQAVPAPPHRKKKERKLKEAAAERKGDGCRFENSSLLAQGALPPRAYPQPRGLYDRPLAIPSEGLPGSVALNEGDDDEADEHSRRCILYECSIHTVTPAISANIRATLATHSHDAFEFAVREAEEHNHRNWAYIKRILDNPQRGQLHKPKAPQDGQQGRCGGRRGH